MKQQLTVISFSGPSGAGKTTALKQLDKDYKILPERYMELNIRNLDNRLIISKWAYINYWNDNVLRAQEDGVSLLITDRCPIDTCAYINQGKDDLLNVINLGMNELKLRDIIVKKILITASFEVLQERVNSRLEKDKKRLFYNEGDYEHNRKAFMFFEENKDLWNHTIDTSKLKESDAIHQIEVLIKSVVV